jgi:putative transposase
MSQAAYARGRPKPNDKWHLDEVVIVINGVNHWPSRAVDANGDVLDILVQRRRNTKAARRFFKKLIALWQAKCCGHRQARQLHQANPEPCSTGRSQADQRAHKGLNTRIEGSHRPTRKREKIMGHSKSLRQV